ncbi:MAG TPA: SagB/ThcOx family dehydrogenase [Aromatoleum sp.]|uniref:SagB/ThcOx family dehydrogenase n=1 Tax=Aromatoleum sp. TaxID=2307007 RepID=UPI002B48BC8C|nr:SagB/ThcOx family dehydrogenase [Aromatoleum sp.]HJV26564.1 SagB/ThcOx family dehydrogenase [Aromatoleum sp.]
MDIPSYHQRSKHRLDAYAPGPGRLDWANQPDPWRRFEGAPRVQLPFGADGVQTHYEDVRQGLRPPVAALTLPNLAVLFELSLALSAWKEFQGSRWALRCNPSSGNLHPTEAYLVAPTLPGLAGGVHHYLSRDHVLEQRTAGGTDWDAAFGEGAILVALSSIHWREAWKYGMRAYRYCQHDCGHAIAAISVAAAALGWAVRVIDHASDDDIVRLAGLDRDADYGDAEREAPDVLLQVGDAAARVDIDALLALAADARWQGQANRLSESHVEWRDIDAVAAAVRKPRSAPAAAPACPALPAPAATVRDLSVATLVRQRRSAVAFDGVTTMSSDAFFAMLDVLLPRSGVPPFDAWPEAPQVHLAIFAHRVTGLEPGLYLLLRDAAALDEVRAALREDWLWVKTGPAHLPLYLLIPYDLRASAELVSCHQEIAADSCFALGMLARFGLAQREAWRYPQLYRECGMVGHMLYLEAEAAGLRGTGIGCFFDDVMHELLGLAGDEWQSLYHFTVGGPVEDSRLSSLPPY